MADNTEFSLDGGSFSIQDTISGTGNQALLNSLYESETATADPKDVQPIIKDAEPATPPGEPAKPAGKEITPVASDADPKIKAQAAISNFLGSGEEEEDDDVVTSTETTTLTPRGEEDDLPVDKFAALATDLFSLGVFVKGEDEEDVAITNPQELLERFNMEKERGGMQFLENYLSRFGEDYRSAFTAIYEKGVDPKDYFSVYNTIVNFTELDLSVEDNQVKVMRQALADQGFEPEDIDTEIDRIKNYGDLEVVATKNHKVLVKKEAQKLSQMEAKAEQDLQQKTAIKNQFIQNVQGVLTDKLKAKEFDGIPLNPKLATELQDFLLVDKWKTPTGETLTDFDRTILDLKRPENHATKVKIALLLKILEKDPTLSTIQKSGVTKKTDVLFGEVARQVTKDKSVPAAKSGSTSTSWGNL